MFLCTLWQWVIRFGGVSTAFLHAALEEPVLLVPSEILRHPGCLWRLHKAQYGLREAPRLFQQHLAHILKDCGFTRSLADPQFYRHETAERIVACVLSVHADDILIGAAASQLQSFVDAISKKLVIKWAATFTVATEPSPWVRYLGKQWRRTPQGSQVAVSADYLKKVFAALGLEQAKAAPTPAVLGARSDGEPLSEAEGHLYRTLVGRLMWMLPERADIAYVTRELARSVHVPLRCDMGRLRRLVK